MKLLIVAPRYTYRKGDYYEFPLGLGYICSVLKKEGYEVSVLNLNQFENENNVDVITEYLKFYQPDIVLTGGLTAFYHLIKEIIDTIKIYDSSIYTIVGGGIVSSEFELVANMLQADFVVDGEGEVTIIDLVRSIEKGLDPATVNGIGYFKKNKFYRTLPRDVMSAAEMDELPMPDYDAFGLEEYFSRQSPASEYYLHLFDEPRVLPIITSRSCPLKCTFCFHPLGNKYRMRNMDKISEEITEMKKKYNLNILLILDELMVGSKKRLFQFCDMIKEHHINWICQLWPNLIDEETIVALKESGCYYISFGLESASDTILKSMAKTGCTVADMEKGLKLSQEHHIGIQGNFIFGDKNETVETARETLDWWQNNRQYQINLSPIIPYPGSPDFKIAVENGVIKDKEKYIRDGCPTINMSKMTDSEYKSIMNEVSEKANDKENRIFGEVLSIEQTHYHSTKSTKMYTLSVRCPHCEQISNYKNFHQVYINYFKLACRSCNQRFDLSPNIFPNSLNSLLKEGLNYKSLWMTPCMPEHYFKNMMDLLGLNYEEFPIEGFLDKNVSKTNNLYLDKYPIKNRFIASELIKKNESYVVILPSNHAIAIYDELIDKQNIMKEKVIMLDPRITLNDDKQKIKENKNIAALRNDVSWYYQSR